MFIHSFVFGFLVLNAEGVLVNKTCPKVKPRELDWKALDGTWYLSAIAADDMQVKGDCAIVLFDHQNTTDIYISWISNNTVTYYNGSVALTPDPNSNTTGDLLFVAYDDQKSERYSFLDVNYEHYAVMFACYNHDDFNGSTYEIWKLVRTPHLKHTDAIKLDQAIANYSLQDTPFITFNIKEDTCRINSGQQVDTSAMVLTSAAAFALYRFY